MFGEILKEDLIGSSKAVEDLNSKDRVSVVITAGQCTCGGQGQSIRRRILLKWKV